MTHAIQKKILQLFFLLYLLMFISVLPAVAQSKFSRYLMPWANGSTPILTNPKEVKGAMPIMCFHRQN